MRKILLVFECIEIRDKFPVGILKQKERGPTQV
jgi:hypothetical protein